MSINFVLNLFFSISAGLFMRLAFPEYNFFLLAWVIFAPFVLAIIREKSLLRTTLYSALYGGIFYGLIFSWCPVFYDLAPRALINLGWFGYALSQTFFVILTTLIFKLLQNNLNIKNRIINNLVQILNFSFLWIFFDWLRSLSIFGNTVGGICYSQYLFLPFLSLAKYIGPYGLTFIIVFFNASLAVFLHDQYDQKQKSTRRFWLILGVVLLTTFSWWLKDSDLFKHEKTGTLGGMVQPADRYAEIIDYRKNQKPNTLRIAVYQPAIPQSEKLNFESYDNLKEKYINAVRGVYQFRKPDLVILPETIVPEFLLNDKVFMFNLTDALESSIVFGTPRWKDKSKGLEYYNSAVMLNRRGELLGYHDKKYLVPFGEYVPFRQQLYFLFKGSGFLESEYNPGNTVSPMGDFATSICFESTLPYQLRQQVRNGGKALLVVTNDAWFKQSFVLELHLASAAFRAAENNRYLVQAANSGISAIIDNQGRIIKKSNVDQEEWLEEEIKFSTELTPYTLLGELIIYLAIIYLAFIFYRMQTN